VRRRIVAIAVDEILIDTDILVDLAREFNPAIAFFGGLSVETTVHVSVITKMELFVGCRNKVEQRRTGRFLEVFSMLPITQEDSLLACRILTDHYLSQGIGILDCLIGASAIRRKIPLVTKNKKHFSELPGLTVIAPY
jgi:predicted nucleic acid-binding protein